MTRASLIDSLLRYARYTLGQELDALSSREVFEALSLGVRDQIIDAMLASRERFTQADAKRLYYVSMEFLVGRSLGNNLCNLGLLDVVDHVASDLGFKLADLERMESDAALGNGGLGRLAACFLDSLATLDMPGYGYGINYEYGFFKQEIHDGEQREQADNWLAFPTPWLIPRPDRVCPVPLYGRVEDRLDRHGRYRPTWVDWRLMKGVPSDMPIVGHGGNTVNVLRLFSAHAAREFDMEIFNDGDFVEAIQRKVASEYVSKVLYPTDEFQEGVELRLVQEYFLVSCSVRDILRRCRRHGTKLEDLPDKVAIQLNDTHPALTVAELMRTLVDENSLNWDDAWEITQGCLGYTNHTLMPEALERWPVPLLQRVLPRHLQIIHEINRRFLNDVAARFPGDPERLRRMSIIDEGETQHVRMAHLSVVGSHAVNGVAAMHSELVKERLLPDFYEMWPERFSNKTNGVTVRRWIVQSNPELAGLITDAVGDDSWVTDFSKVQELEQHADDAEFQYRFYRIKRTNRHNLAHRARASTEIVVDPTSLFDVHVKRIHEYKRQLLNVMHIIHRYLELVEDGKAPTRPRTWIFAGKAAPGYWLAKQIIRLITHVGAMVNSDRRVKGLMKVVFLADYRVSLAQCIIPAADISEQISTAGTEASGTGNMKLAMNGALTIGTLDGANIEILEQVGEENFYS
ncbi:MAG TPA: glycogen/starch/alpha-glucan phosphorylase, partial [Armatimonadota bacterium]|nr:glycogen/starch/alpha-glucan phosphorylase [Armatimonadota bacterium]